MKKLNWMLAATLSFMFVLSVQSTANAIILFSDDFQDNNINGWVVAGGGTAFATTSSAVTSPVPSGNPYALLFATIDDPYISMTQTINTASFSNISFTYDRRTRSFDSGDSFEISWARTGESFNILESLSGTNDSWETKTWNLPNSADNTSIDIRFAVLSDQSTSGFSYGDHGLFDDVNISGNVIPEPASMVLLSTGMLGMIGLRRKKKIS